MLTPTSKKLSNRGGKRNYGGYGAGGAEGRTGFVSNRKRTTKGRDANAGSDALTGADAPSDAEVWQAIWEEAYGKDLDAKAAALAEKNRLTDEALQFEKDSARASVELMKDVPDIIGDTADMKAEAHKKDMEALDAGVQAGQQLAGAFIKDEGMKAVISGGIETARAISAGASGNIPGAIGHGAAAAQFFAVAAQAGAGGGKKRKTGRGGGGSQSGASMSREREAVGRIGGGKGSSAAPAPVVINVSPTFLPHQEQVRQFADDLEREARTRTGGFWGGIGR